MRDRRLLQVERRHATGAPGSIGAPMPGVVISVAVRTGDTVEAGDTLAVLSAMKMETSVSAPISGVVKSLDVAVGDDLKAGELILTIDA